MGTTEPPVTESQKPRTFETYLKYAAVLAAVPYALGFLTVMLHTGRYGLPVIQLIQPINFWVGLIPSIFLLGVWKVLRLPQKSSVNQLPVRFVNKVGVPRARLLNVLLLLLANGIILCAAIPLRHLRSGHDQLSEWLLLVLMFVAAIAVKWAQGLLFFGLPWRGDIPATFSAEWYVRGLFLSWVILVACLTLQAYVVGIYPKLPQRYGFGHPSSVRLVVDPRKISQELLESQSADVETAKVTRPVLLLYRTGQEHIILCEQCKAKTFSLNNAVVFGIIWQKSSEPEKAQSK